MTEGRLFAVALLVACAAAWLAAEPTDWDPAYYLTVARHLARGDGAVTSAVWSVAWLPEALPFAADLHWMPLPSRVLVPGEWLWPGVGGRVTAAVLAAAWAPLAWRVARRLDPAAAPLAGALAAVGCGYAGWVATPDSGGLYGVLGTLALLSASGGPLAATVTLAALAALTRNDGFLLAPCLALAVWARGQPRGALLVAVAGPLTTAAWTARGAWIAGPAWLEARRHLGDVLDTESLATLTLGGATPPSLSERLAFLAQDGLSTTLLVAAFALPWPWLFALRGRDPLRIAVGAYAVVLPVVALALAPGIAASGSVFRSSAALAPAACALAAVALLRAGRWGQRVRDYHPAFLPGLGVATIAVATALVAGPRLGPRASPLPATVCDTLSDVPPGAAVFTAQPLLLEAHCDRPAVLLAAPMTATQAAALAARYHVRYALVADTPDPMAVDAAGMARLLPGWTLQRSAAGAETWAAPSPI